MENGDLRVWWIPQIPGKPFYVPVTDLEEAIFIHDTLAAYDIFQFENNIKPDYSNGGGLEIYDDGEWYDWGSDDGREFEDILDDETTVRRFGGST